MTKQLLQADGTDTLQGCCGVDVLFDLKVEPEVEYEPAYIYGHLENLTAAEYKKLKKDEKIEYVRKISEELENTGLADNRATIATTNAKEQKEEEKRLKALKFRKVGSFVNPATKNTINLWFRKPKTKKRGKA